MAKQKACKICRTVYEGKEKCPSCGSKEHTETIKGRIIVINPEKSEIANKIGLKTKGEFAIKTR
ncbi:DNA-directed RNA polymerase subunit E'' [archaeon]|jgi:DNA-directed RNA polymerase subunit E"|nr:DNA-directed RNA polymerase subunit E'' [archaeon]MBT4373477.1 DNA-directed RNA polymerase subunit E'' [archaeon]MBT4531925.1 DNA-directed RNA polymerase subunit E'' [archaeon]MBT7001592.1 DNA-directed RNA polymerase subunit E'' [archaeon]MBT7282516.1 DNA-directed RNA polymerase subunit E'' [archaeon]